MSRTLEDWMLERRKSNDPEMKKAIKLLSKKIQIKKKNKNARTPNLFR